MPGGAGAAAGNGAQAGGLTAGDRFGRTLAALWQTIPEEGGRPLRVWARLDSGEYASAEWEGGGPEAGWYELIEGLRKLHFETDPAQLDALPLPDVVELAALPDAKRDVAFVWEEEDEQSFQPSGRFGVHLEIADGDFRDGPQDTEFRAAVSWARERSDGVLFRPGGTNHHYSLGAWPVPETPSWPEGIDIRARPERTPLDGSVHERPWSVRARCATVRPLPPLPRSVRAELVEHVAGAQGWTAMVDVMGTSMEDAIHRLASAFEYEGADEFISLSTGWFE